MKADNEEVEEDFISSWICMEAFFERLDRNGHPGSAQMRVLIAQMREEGFDKTLRAGQSIYYLVLSRSRKHGLVEGQHRIGIEARPEEQFEVEYYDGKSTLHQVITNIPLQNEEFIRMLTKLVTQPIN